MFLQHFVCFSCSAQALISRGLQLEGQVVTEGQDLQVLVEKAQTNSPIQHLNAAALEDRVTEAVAQAQVLTVMDNGFTQQP